MSKVRKLEMPDFVNVHPGVSIVGWSLLCAAAIIGLSEAHKHAGFPDLELWVLPVWFVGFFHLARRVK